MEAIKEEIGEKKGGSDFADYESFIGSRGSCDRVSSLSCCEIWELVVFSWAEEVMKW